MSSVSVPRRASLVLAAGVFVVALAGTRSVTPREAATVAGPCPPGFVSADAQASQLNRERRAEVAGLRARDAGDRPSGACRARSAPERAADLLTVQADSGRRARGGQAGVKPGAYAAAGRGAAAMSSRPPPGSGGPGGPGGHA